MRHLLIAVLALFVSGCASTAIPNLFNGSYYMAGDPACVNARALSSTRIMCSDKKGNETGYRDAMTIEQMQMYQMQVAQQQIQMQQISQSLQQVGQTFQNASNQIAQQNRQFVAPQVQPINTQGYGGTTYVRSGNTWVGSNGSSCQIVGQSILCSDGRKCQLIGQNLICN